MDVPEKEHARPPFFWSEVQAVLDGKVRAPRRGFYRPDTHTMCPKCGKQMKWRMFSSGPETFAGMCGVAGWIEVCVPCKEWTDIQGMIVNG